MCCNVQPSDDRVTFQGSIRVLMNLIRPISMCISVQPPTLHDVTVEHDSSNDDMSVTSFYLPKDTTKLIHISRWAGCCLALLRFICFQSISQGDHLSGKPGNVGEFDRCQGNVRDFAKNQGNVREKILSVKSCLKLFIVNCNTAYLCLCRYLVGV